MSRLRVLWRSSLGAESARQASSEGIDLRVETDRRRALRLRDWVQVLVDGDPLPQMLDGAALEHVVVPYAGLSGKLRRELLTRPHLRAANSHFNAPFVAQHAVALLLACCNRIVEGDTALRRGDWGPHYDQTFTSLQLDGLTALLLGYGAIGRELEVRLSALGMTVTAYRRRATTGGANRRQYGPGELHQALAASDVVLVSLPATPATDGLLDDAAFAAMRRGTVLVNVGRGTVIDPWALYRALRAGQLRGAGLDVWWRYPSAAEQRTDTLPAEPPLHELPTVVMSPHRANQVDDWESAAFLDVLATLHAIASGGSRNAVDLNTGY